MQLIYSLKLFFVTLCLSVLSMNSSIAQTGNVQGVITDENGIYMIGASVLVESTGQGSVTDFDGRFTLVGVPTGAQKLKIAYLGFADQVKDINVEEGTTSAIVIELKEEDLSLAEIQVTGFKVGGQAKALNTQKNNMNITNVVSTDQIGKFPDANIGDAVKRIPGITMQVDQGEARNIIVRGLSPQLNSVTLNGSRIPSAEGDNRNIQMDLIPSDMIQTIEVNKAVTPDMDADALGGSVNLVTRTAPQGFRFAGTLGSGVNFITNKRILNGSFLLGDRIGNGKLGWMIAASANDNDFGSDNVEANWSNEFKYLKGDEEQEIEVDPYTDAFEQRTYLVQRIRRSFSANLDYQISADHNVFFKSMYNWRDDRENRFRLEHEVLDGEDIEEGDFTLTNGALTRFPVGVKRQSKGGIDNDRNQNRRLEDQRMQNYSLGGKHLFGKMKVDWLASYAHASEERNDERYAEYESEYTILNDNSDPEFPLFTPEDASFANDLNNFEFGEITNENQYTDEEDVNAFLNFELPADFFGNGNGIVKFGARGRFKQKERDNDFFEFDLEDTYPTLGGIPTKDYTDEDYLAGSQYQAGFFADEEWLGGLDLSEGESVPDEFLRDNFEVEENVLAGYVMTQQNVTKNLSILAGLRVEATDLTATGNQIEDEENVIGKITEESDYVNVLPGVHFKYDLNNNTVFRLAWTNTIARPNYVDMVPSRDVVFGDEEIYLGNPSLDPTTSMNFDLMAEHYFKNVGILSGGLFYKDISDFVYTFQTGTTDETYGAGTEGFNIFQPLNGDNATVFGAEVSLQRQLDFLPGFAKNFSIYLNYTYLTSSADGIRNEDGDERSDLDLPNTAPNMFNGSLGYADKRFMARISVNFSDSYIDEIGGNAFEDRYYDHQLFVDFNTSFAITSNLRFYADLSNITDQPLRYFQGVSERTQQLEYYGRRLTFGIKYDFFRR